jgi:hypothetical protein
VATAKTLEARSAAHERERGRGRRDLVFIH